MPPKQLSKLLMEQTNLRTQMEDLFAQRAAITLQMKEIEERLQWLDAEIDHVESEQDVNVAHFTQHPDEVLTDPTSDDIEEAVGYTLVESKRISESPDFTRNEQNTNQNIHQTSTSQHEHSGNPFGDLWSAKDRNQFGHHGDSRINCAPLHSKSVVANKSTTLERYFIRTEPPAGTTAPMQSNTHRSISPNSMNRRNISSNNHNQNVQQFPWTKRMYYHLNSTFHITSFRDHQLDIINGTLSNRDVFVIMRTGGGKSLTYQLPAILEMESSKKVTIVVSPLISLIRDQEEQMNQMYPGSATSFTSGMGREEHTQRWARVRDANGSVALVFVTPEKVGKSGKFKGEMEKLYSAGRLGRFVIDEAHCATQWGHDFRPDYTKLGILKHHFPSIPVLAVTATASDRVRKDCCDILRLDRNHLLFRSTANRPNLTYMVKCKADSKDTVITDMVAFIKENHTNEAGIIYTFSRKEADEVANAMCSNGILAQAYHSDVSDSRKNMVHRSWMRNDTQVVVATIAFGLGINKPDVRFVLHHSLSKSLEAYYQESGRAGRDGQSANCVLYYTPKDVPRMLGMIHGEAGESSFWGMVRYGQAHGDDQLCRHAILATLGEIDTSSAGDKRINSLREQCKTTQQRDIGVHAKTATQVVNAMLNHDEPCTLNQIVKKWRSKVVDSNFSFLKGNSPAKDLTKEECERTIITLLLQDILHPNIVYTAYSTICYLRLGPLAQKMLTSADPHVTTDFPVRAVRTKSTPKQSHEESLVIANDDGWITRKDQQPRGGKRKCSATKTKKTACKAPAKTAKNSYGGSVTKTKKTTCKTPAKTAKNSFTGSAVPREKATQEVVEINSSSSETSEDEFLAARRRAAKKKPRLNVLYDDCSID